MSESLITKKALAAAMKELTKKKSLNRIGINEITEYCGLNRQTFYYHFHDKFELVNWIYFNEAIAVVKENLTYKNWTQKVLELLIKMKSEEYFYCNTLKYFYENGFRENLFHIASELFLDIITQIGVVDQNGQEEKKFISEFYAFGIVGIIISWAQHGMKEPPEYIASHLKNLSEGTQKFAAMHYLEKN